LRLRPLAAVTAVCAVSSALVIGAACGFPDPVLLELDGAPRPGPDGTLPDGALPDGNTPGPDGEVDGGADADSGPEPCARPCDCDEDGFLDEACDGGTDCDDHDDRRKPDAGYRLEVPLVPASGDWNCNETVEREFPVGNLSCGGFSMGVCPTRSGFTGAVPECGLGALFHQCVWNPAGSGSCQGNPREETQRCK
jgi:hypothetical protein